MFSAVDARHTSTSGVGRAVYRAIEDVRRRFESQAAESRLGSVEAEQLSLLRPVDRQLRRQAHQCFGVELRRVASVDDGRDYVGRERREPQQAIPINPTNHRAVDNDGVVVGIVRKRLFSVDFRLLRLGSEDKPHQ